MSLREFGWNELYFLIFSARWTVLLSLIAFGGGGAAGLIIAACRIAPRPIVRRAAAIWITALQGTPLLVQLLIVYYAAPFIGFRPNAWTAAAIAFTINSSAFFGEIWRGCLQSIPAGQWDGARALGFRFIGALRLVVLPQAVRLMIPPTIGYMVQIIKSTSVASLIGIAELTRTAVLINTVTFEPVHVFGTVTLTYFLMCWPLSLLADYTSRRIEKRRAAGGIGELLRTSVRRRPWSDTGLSVRRPALAGRLPESAR
ncbi:MAG TPA: amino acid ABC transporter permease [Acetobacteraceae bacterium]|jgi:polar amino acid transport system permease protein|nr:amino acid ABC transporter permease [Acetobacteraceae bacterium]